jgi:hypothetical protein
MGNVSSGAAYLRGYAIVGQVLEVDAHGLGKAGEQDRV